MRTYTFSQARQNFASILDQARRDGKVYIKRRDGSLFALEPVPRQQGSPLDVEGIDLDLDADEIVALIRETRER